MPERNPREYVSTEQLIKQTQNNSRPVLRTSKGTDPKNEVLLSQSTISKMEYILSLPSAVLSSVNSPIPDHSPSPQNESEEFQTDCLSRSTNEEFTDKITRIKSNDQEVITPKFENSIASRFHLIYPIGVGSWEVFDEGYLFLHVDLGYYRTSRSVVRERFPHLTCIFAFKVHEHLGCPPIEIRFYAYKSKPPDPLLILRSTGGMNLVREGCLTYSISC